MVEDIILNALKTDSGVNSLVVDRIMPSPLSQQTELPAITWDRISEVREHSHDGPSALSFPKFQFSCWSEKRDEARALSEAVRKALDGKSFSGTGFSIQGCFLEDTRSLFEPTPRPLHRADLDFSFHLIEGS